VTSARRVRSGASPEVFVPFSVRWPRSRPHVSRRPPASLGLVPLRRFAVPARAFSLRTCRHNADLAGFRALSGPIATKLGWRACGPSVWAESVAHVYPVPARASTRTPAHRTWRRLDGLLLAATVHLHRPSNSGAAGATGSDTRLEGPTTRAPSRERPPDRPRVIRQTRLFRVAFRYPCDRSVAWPDDAGLPSFAVRRRSWGSSTLRRFAPADGWTISGLDARHKRRG
jgi:hypothetical protein